MAVFDFSGLQQAANRNIHNWDEAIRKWQEFITAPAGQVSMQYYDRNGNLQTVVFDNKNKLIQDFITNVNSAMNKTFYVDAINGNDLNDGSQTAPFKTLKKAVDSVPAGGFAEIVLLSNVELANEAGSIWFNRKQILLNLNGNTLSKTNTFNQIFCSYGFGHLQIIKGSINIVSTNSSAVAAYQTALINVFDGSASVIFGDYANVIGLDTDAPVVNIDRAVCIGGAIKTTMTQTGNFFNLTVVPLFWKVDTVNDKAVIFNKFNTFNTGTAISN